MPRRGPDSIAWRSAGTSVLGRRIRGAELIDTACVNSSLDIANRIGADPPTAVILASPGKAQTHLRLRAAASGGSRHLERFNAPLDTLLVSGPRP